MARRTGARQQGRERARSRGFGLWEGVAVIGGDVGARRRGAVSEDDFALLLMNSLARTGWVFEHGHDDGGRLVELRGRYRWPSAWQDRLTTRGPDSATAVRTDPQGRETWSAAGSVVAVIGELLAQTRPPGPLPAVDGQRAC